MNLISIKFNEARSMNITSNCTKNRGNLIKYYRSYHKYKKIYGSIEFNKRANQVTANLESPSLLTADSTLASSTTSSQVQLRNFSNEMILIKKERTNKLEPISNTQRKLNSLETKLNDFIRQQQLRRTSKFSAEKYTDITAKVFQPKFTNETLIKAEKRLKIIEQERQRTSSFSFAKTVPKLSLEKTADPKEPLDQNDNFIVKGIFAFKDNNQSKANFISIKPKLVPLRVITSKTDTSPKRVISKSADTDLHHQQQKQQYLVELEPRLNKSQCAYTSAVSSSSHLKSNQLRLVNSETTNCQCSTNNNLEFIQNQKQVYILHRDILNQIHERSMSSLSKYKTRINIEGELSEVMDANSPANLLNEINKSYKFYERVRPKQMKIKPIKPNSVPASIQKTSASQRILLKQNKNEEKEENFTDEDDDEAEFDEDYDDLMDDIDENNLR